MNQAPIKAVVFIYCNHCKAGTSAYFWKLIAACPRCLSPL